VVRHSSCSPVDHLALGTLQDLLPQDLEEFREKRPGRRV
jgi:hypothetical protein